MRKKVIISIILTLVIAGGIGYFFWNKVVEAKEMDLAYQNKLVDTLGLIETSTTSSSMLAVTYQEYWGEIIDRSISFSSLSEGLNIDESTLEDMTDYSQRAHFMNNVTALKQGEFDLVISMVRLAKKEDTNLVLAQHDSITKAISDLKNPSEKFQNNYNSLLEIYEIYDTFVSLSTSPTGSYIEYSKNINSTFENLSSKTKTTKLQIN